MDILHALVGDDWAAFDALAEKILRFFLGLDLPESISVRYSIIPQSDDPDRVTGQGRAALVQFEFEAAPEAFISRVFWHEDVQRLLTDGLEDGNGASRLG